MKTLQVIIKSFAIVSLSAGVLMSCANGDDNTHYFDEYGNLIMDLQFDERFAGLWVNVYNGTYSEYSENAETDEAGTIYEFKESGLFNIYYRETPGSLTDGIVKGCSLEDFELADSYYATCEDGMMYDLAAAYFYGRYSFPDEGTFILDQDGYCRMFRKVSGFEDNILVRSINDEIFLGYDNADRLSAISVIRDGISTEYRISYGRDILITSASGNGSQQWLCTLSMYNDRLDTIKYQDRTTEYEYSEDTGLLESMAGNRYRWEDGNLISGGETVESVYLETENRMNIDIYGDCPFGLKLDGLASRDYVKSRICTEGGQTVTRTYEYEFTEDGMVDVMTVTTVSGENRDIKTYRFSY